MKIAVLSDIHDHLDNLNKALKEIEGNAKAIIFCGDMCAPFTAAVLAKADLPVYACLGNNDEDQIGLFRKSGKNFTWTGLYQEFGEVELENSKIAFCHHPQLGKLLAKSSEYNAVFHGHTHISRSVILNKTLLLNPGAVCGINPRELKYDKASYAIYDTQTSTAEITEIK